VKFSSPIFSTHSKIGLTTATVGVGVDALFLLEGVVAVLVAFGLVVPVGVSGMVSVGEEVTVDVGVGTEVLESWEGINVAEGTGSWRREFNAARTSGEWSELVARSPKIATRSVFNVCPKMSGP
jgi:hypothetical protein